VFADCFCSPASQFKAIASSAAARNFSSAREPMRDKNSSLSLDLLLKICIKVKVFLLLLKIDVKPCMGDSVFIAHGAHSSKLNLVPMLRIFKQSETSSCNFYRVASHVPEMQ
jgi:hypothetical protein